MSDTVPAPKKRNRKVTVFHLAAKLDEELKAIERSLRVVDARKEELLQRRAKLLTSAPDEVRRLVERAK